MKENMENKKLLESFTDYCNKYPKERFWQALRNWSSYNFILVADDHDFENGEFKNIKDTFYWE